MLGMFWIALELSNPMEELITRLSLLLKNLTAFKFGNAASDARSSHVMQLKPVRISKA